MSSITLTTDLVNPDPLSIKNIWNSLSETDIRLLEELTYLCSLKAKTSKSGARWCQPGLEYLAGKLGRSIWTISRHVSKLKRLGVISVFQPRPKHGEYSTNLYKVVKQIGWKVAAIYRKLRKSMSRLPVTANIASLRREDLSVEMPRAPMKGLPAVWMERGKG